MAIYDDVAVKYPASEYVDDALYNKAWALITMERKEEAVPIFERIVAEHTNGRYGPQSQFTLGDYYYGLKEYDKATASYEHFLELFTTEQLQGRDKQLVNKAVTLLGHLAEIDAYNLYAQGEVLFDQKKYDEAVEIFKQVQVKYPESDQAVNAMVNIGAAFMAQEEYRQAGAVFQEVVDKYSDNDKYLAQVDFSKQQLEVMQEARVL
jgi:TolA-binding protein